MATPKLFEPVTFRSVTARNRITVSPMCQYSAHEGLGNDWHVQHLGARATGGAGIVFTEATHVSAVGRITPGCLGLYTAEHQAHLTRLAAIITKGGAVPGIQIAHAGRKASSVVPWEGAKMVPPEAGGWTPLGPTAEKFGEAYAAPHPISTSEIAEIVTQFAQTVRMARAAGFKIIELHAAHGYLIHSFLSPISNTRNDSYGGDMTGRSRLLMEVLEAATKEWPEDLPIFVRISTVDHLPGGLTVQDSIDLARRLKATNRVDLIDCSSGGIAATGTRIPSLHPGYQVPYAEAIKHQAQIPTGAVGLITAASHAAEIIGNDRADLVFLARAVLADPAWPLRAAKELGAPIPLPPQY